MNNIYRVFLNHCANGELTLAAKIIKENPNINISYNDDYAFRLACWCGRLRVARWLLSIKPNIDISVLNEFAF